MTKRFNVALAIARITQVIDDQGPKTEKQLSAIVMDKEMKPRHIREAIDFLTKDGDYRFDSSKKLQKNKALLKDEYGERWHDGFID